MATYASYICKVQRAVYRQQHVKVAPTLDKGLHGLHRGVLVEILEKALAAHRQQLKVERIVHGRSSPNGKKREEKEHRRHRARTTL